MESRLNIRQYAKKDEDIKATLNRIAILAKKEVEDYYRGMCDNNTYRTMIKAHYIPLIERLANDNWHKINNEVNFIDDCFRRVMYAIRTFDIYKGDFDKRVKCFIYQGLRKYCGERGKRRTVLTLISDINVLETLEDCAENAEEKAICNIMTNRDTYAKLYKNVCGKEIDVVILDAMIETVERCDRVTEYDIARTLSTNTGRSFDSARGAVRGFKQRIRKRSIRKEDVA
ncbi:MULTISPECIES: hypothetical protein [Bacillus cereus group]|uniref:Uncharacterized protein n=1 Tax=Bacillus toyonensis TaxID=155322 RepID=A0A2B5B8X1_9BACI|nr:MULTISPECIES: hypothetical protein [Bacillus cereus group]MCU5573312.1 hypothetical protein [Bacillus wiedmannii]PEJ98748.1 hypothetical protein CN688_05265 [Bacillus toyonensis]PEK85017.1 hypothetical protein CN594_15740 [Bacillus toyonensis]PEL24636.1 hypothetical protein CN624_17585 [Bacillus toyonensis]PEO53669.1 hypothetical protein CN579_24630 [Bacillus toyonensis]